MRRILAVLALLSFLGCRTPASLPAGPLPGVVAVYVYADVVRKPQDAQAFLAFARQCKLSQVYLQSAHLVRECPEALGAFCSQAREAGVSVTLLAGRSAWALEPGQAEALQVAREARIFTEGLREKGKPAPEAIQFDVEPYLLPRWKVDPQGVANQYLDLFEKLRETLGGRLRLQACIPFWFDRVKVRRRGLTRPLSEWILDASDGAVLMDYRDTAQRLVSGVEGELAYASRIGKPLVVAVNIAPSDEKRTSFHGQSEAKLRRVLEDARAPMLSYGSFDGIAVFHYEFLGGKGLD